MGAFSAGVDAIVRTGPGPDAIVMASLGGSARSTEGATQLAFTEVGVAGALLLLVLPLLAPHS